MCDCGRTGRPHTVQEWLEIKIAFEINWPFRDVFAGATGATAVAPKFSDTLTLSQPGGADSAHHRRGRT